MAAALVDFTDRIGTGASARSRAAASAPQGPLHSLHLVSHTEFYKKPMPNKMDGAYLPN